MAKQERLKGERLPLGRQTIHHKRRHVTHNQEPILPAMRATGMPALQKKLVQRDLERSRRFHPHLRWPRRARRRQSSCYGGSSFASSKAFEVHWPESHDQDWSGCGEFDEAENLQDAQDVIPPLNSGVMASSSRSLTFMSSTGTFSGFSRRQWREEQRGEMIPPKRRPREEPSPCSAATVHLPQLSIGGGQSDRKYHLRQAPISQVIALERCPAGDSSGNDKEARLPNPKTGRKESRKPINGRYVNFQSWGLDDAYLKSLFQRADIDWVEHLNLSDNRLTDESILFLADRFSEVAHPKWLLQSLHLAKNRLMERGCRAVGSLIHSTEASLLHLDLSDNMIGDKPCEELCEVLIECCRDLKELALARNELGRFHESVGDALGRLVSECSSLEMLDLHWNLLHGAGAVAFFTGIYENGSHGGQLRKLDLSWNRLGLRCGNDTRDVQTDSESVQARRPFSPPTFSNEVKQSCTCKACTSCVRMAKMLASVFQDCSTLFHLDLSYNKIRCSECAIIADGLRTNQTLFGLHLVGNEASVDEYGFVIPCKPTRMERALEIEEQRSNMQRLNEAIPHVLRLERNLIVGGTVSRGECLVGSERMNPSLQVQMDMKPHQVTISADEANNEMDWVAARARVQQPIEFGSSSDSVRLNDCCCWICHNWVEHRISYIPGWSGPEADCDEVKEVLAFFSTDSFVQSTKLVKVKEPFQRLQFNQKQKVRKVPDHSRSAGKRRSLLNGLAQFGRMPMPCLTTDGLIVRWTASRMLPPSTEAVEVIFRVNGEFVAAQDLPMKSVCKSVPVQDMDCMETSADGGRGPTKLVEVHEVNLIQTGLSAFQMFSRGESTALLVLEDPKRRGEFSVRPRQLIPPPPPRPPSPWSFEKSIWAKYVRDTEAMPAACFDADWPLTKLESHVKNIEVRKVLAKFLRNSYLRLMLAFYHHSFLAFKPSLHAAGLNMIAFTELLTKDPKVDASISRAGSVSELRESGGQVAGNSSTDAVTPEAPVECSPRHKSDSTLFNSSFTQGQVDTLFIASSVVDKSKKSKLAVLPDKGLARFQFTEAFVRVAVARFQDWGHCSNASEAVRHLFNKHHIGEDMLEQRNSLHRALFCEECDMVYKDYQGQLETIYNTYKKLHSYPGRSGYGLSYSSWNELLQDCEAVDSFFAARNIGWAFALGKEIRPDEYTCMRHMELSWSEFLVCLGAVVRLRYDYEEDFFADSISEFFEGSLVKAHHRCLERNEQGQNTAGILQDPSIKLVLEFVGKVFQDADEDQNGRLNCRELRRSLMQPKFQSEMKDLKIEVDDLTTLFHKMDTDGSGDVALDELCEMFVKMKLAMKGANRAIAYFRKIFKEADRDGSCTLSLKEFRDLVGNAQTKKRLATLGISADEMEALFEQMANNSTQEVSADCLVTGLLKVRETGLGESRGLNYLRSVFLEADENKNDCLSREEVTNCLCQDHVRARFEQFKLEVPDWLGIFDALDTDGDGNLSWDELSQGVTKLWKQGIEQDLRKQIRSTVESSQKTGSIIGLNRSSTMTGKASMASPKASAAATKSLPRPAYRRSSTEVPAARKASISSASTVSPSPAVSRSESSMTHSSGAHDVGSSPSPHSQVLFSPTPVQPLQEEPEV